MVELSAAAQDYLKAIWTLQEWDDTPVTPAALVTRLGLSSSTVSEGVRRLAAQGLVDHEPYGAVELTELGRRRALDLVRRHRLIETFLAAELGYGWDEVHDEAEVLEHAVSPRFVERLSARLGDPEHDPHGDPIPRADGTVPDLDAVNLDEAAPGTTVRVVRVSDADPELLRHLVERGLGLGVEAEILGREPYADTVRVRAAGEELSLGPPAAKAVWVTPS